MKKPDPIFPPSRFDYLKDFETENLMNIKLVYDEDYDPEYDDCNDCGEFNKDCKCNDSVISYSYENHICSLSDLMTKIPKDVPFENIDIVINRSRDFQKVNFKVELKKALNKEENQKKYDEAMLQFEIANKKYKADLILYNNWLKDEEIKNLETKLKELKKL